MRYTSSITAGSLKLPESRAVAAVLLQGRGEAGTSSASTPPDWQQAIAHDNVLQAKSPATRQSLAKLIRRRLAHLSATLLELVRDGSQLEAAQACLAGAVMDSRLLGDFLDLVLRPLYRTYKTHLPSAAWADYLDGCHGRDPEMAAWSESTTSRLRSSVFQTLAEAGYLNNTRQRQLQAVHIAPAITRELARGNDLCRYALRCLEVTS